MKKYRFFVLVLILSLFLSLFAGGNAENVENGSESEWIEFGITREEAARGYINSVLYGQRGSERPIPHGHAARDNLMKEEKILYDMALAQAEKIAAGQQANTEFDVATEDLLIPIASITPEELGFPGLNINDDNYQTAYKKANEVLTGGFSLYKAMRAVVLDHPHLFYWCKGLSGKLISANRRKNGEVVNFSVRSTFKAGYTVYPDYTLNMTDEYTVKTNIGVAVTKAAENARAIVNANAGKTDVDKLIAYKDAICEMTSYNYEAAKSGNSNDYGSSNPWHLIWALDGDETTTVICEGYAKAFQYLCDLTNFNSPLVRSILVDGMMDKGKHAWNIVRLEDGKNYLADVTNSDTGTSGQGGELFLAKFATKQEEGKFTVYGYATRKGSYYQFNEDTLALYSASDLDMAGNALPGDVNNDDVVDGRDILRLMKYLAEEIDPETGLVVEIHKNNADVNGDGVVDEKDLLRLVKYFGGENVVLEKGKVSSAE